MGFQDETVYIDGRNRPLYRRRQDDRRVIVGDTVIDNRRIVPYNRYMALRYRNHINFEAYVCLSSIKYLHKYIHKCADYVTIRIADEGEVLDYDEIY